MAKLYFRYGAMGSAKTLMLLAVAHNYTSQGKLVKICKPKVDNRYGEDLIKSRAGLFKKADLIIDQSLNRDEFMGLHCVLVDEAQFLTSEQVEFFRELTLDNVPIICYGLRTDFKGNLFPGSKRLMELADQIEEIKTTCYYCNSKAIFNMRLLNGQPTISGAQVQIGGDESYLPTCFKCFHQKTSNL